VPDVPVKIGPPYTVRGVTYVPAEDPDYDAVGYASWYGGEHAGMRTANGETYDPGRISAAHPTLPLPSYVEVTSLESGRTVLVRINDRGPFMPGRIIDLSRAAAGQLGLPGRGVVPVRVRSVQPPEADRLRLRRGEAAPERPVLSLAHLADLRTRLVPLTAAAPSTVGQRPSGAGYVVQIAAFSERERAEALAARIGARAVAAGPLWRVRLGPYSTYDAAAQGMRTAAAGGFPEARIVANDSP
jgi:rare lipoprotein A